MSQEFLSAVFGWMAVLNVAVLMFTTLMMLLLQDQIADIHGRIFQMERPHVKRAYFRYLANYKVLTLIFCIVPWLALQLA
ncbi:DUF6868 family protein [Ruegeria arenilitoris]|uniref:DUF6868 family protein n=1 Tax=Ruegeria arenilitoris TaxID=1173585 RepID=UPI0014807B19|nr:hypothetical protein [Ruegeria arenilitoris]